MAMYGNQLVARYIPLSHMVRCRSGPIALFTQQKFQTALLVRALLKQLRGRLLRVRLNGAIAGEVVGPNDQCDVLVPGLVHSSSTLTMRAEAAGARGSARRDEVLAAGSWSKLQHMRCRRAEAIVQTPR